MERGRENAEKWSSDARQGRPGSEGGQRGRGRDGRG